MVVIFAYASFTIRSLVQDAAATTTLSGDTTMEELEKGNTNGGIQMAKTQNKSQKQTSQGRGKGGSSSQSEGPQRQEQQSGTLARRESSQSTSPSRDPFMLMRILSDDLDRMAETFGFGRSAGLRDLVQQGRTGMWSPQIEVSEEEGQLKVCADLPGLTKDDVDVEVTDDMILLRGERKQEQEEKRKGYYRSERSYGSFSRAVPLPEGAKADEAKATFKDGVLEITVPTPEQKQKQRRQLQIQ
jgi:HSP20 family protein